MSAYARFLRDPFGPFRVCTILKDKEIRPGHSSDLYNVRFQQNGESIGLDSIEDTDLRRRGTIYFKGDIIIKDSTLLTEVGYRYLRRELEERTSIQLVDISNFLKTNKVKISIIGTLLYHPWDLDYSGLPKLKAKDEELGKEHSFVVRSLHCQTYNLSRLYLSRYHIWRTILDITKDNTTPESSRTPRWFVSAYIRYNQERFHKSRRNNKHTPRRLHRADVYNVLARHATWLREKLRREGKKPLSEREWDLFCRKIGQLRGIPLLDSCDEIENLWPEAVLSDSEEENPRPIKRFNIYQTKNNIDTFMRVQRPEEEEGSREVSPEGEIISEVEKDMLTDPAVLEVTPVCIIREAPEFPSFRPWCCPAPGCLYEIDLYKPSKKNFDRISRDDQKFVLSLRWDPGNSRIVSIFNSIVEGHFLDHLIDVGVRYFVFNRRDENAFGDPSYDKVEVTGPGQITESVVAQKYEWA